MQTRHAGQAWYIECLRGGLWPLRPRSLLVALAQERASFPVLALTKGAKRKLKREQTFCPGDGIKRRWWRRRTSDHVIAAGNRLESGHRREARCRRSGQLGQLPIKSKSSWQWIVPTVIVPPLAVFQDWRVQLVIVLIIAAVRLCDQAPGRPVQGGEGAQGRGRMKVYLLGFVAVVLAGTLMWSHSAACAG